MTDKTPIDLLILEVSSLTSSVNKLVTLDAARIEREKQQEKYNAEFIQFMKENQNSLYRLKRTHSRYDKWGTSIGFLFIVAILTALGFNFKQ